jgi:peptidase M41-like protein
MTALSTKEQERIAHHEAGHAVASIVLGGTFRFVTIEPKPGALGEVRHRPWGKKFQPEVEVTSRIRTQVENAIKSSLAGTYAEKLFTGRWDHHGATVDYHQAYELAEFIAGSPDAVIPYMSWMEVCTADLVCTSRHWATIQALAAELLRRTRLTYAEARQVVADAIDRHMRLPRESQEVIEARRAALYPRWVRQEAKRRAARAEAWLRRSGRRPLRAVSDGFPSPDEEGQQWVSPCWP